MIGAATSSVTKSRKKCAHLCSVSHNLYATFFSRCIVSCHQDFAQWMTKGPLTGESIWTKGQEAKSAIINHGNPAWRQIFDVDHSGKASLNLSKRCLIYFTHGCVSRRLNPLPPHRPLLRLHLHRLQPLLPLPLPRAPLPFLLVLPTMTTATMTTLTTMMTMVIVMKTKEQRPRQLWLRNRHRYVCFLIAADLDLFYFSNCFCNFFSSFFLFF